MISVIIPIYNIESELHHSVDSVISQLNDNWELILVDDGSSDMSGSICDSYSSHKKVKIIHKTNGGLSSARNAGIKAASGEYLLFLDGDDYLRPGSIAMLNTIVSQIGNNFDFIQYEYSEVLDYSNHNQVNMPTEIEIVTDKRTMFERKLKLGGIGASACTKLINRTALGDLKFKEGIIHEDELFTTKMINQAKKAIYINSDPYMYVSRAGSIITSRYSHKKLDIINVLNEQIDILTTNQFFDLADIVKAKLFTALCSLYVKARMAGNKTDALFIKSQAEQINRQTTFTSSGTIRTLSKGMKLHLPVLQSYYLFKKMTNGKI